MTKDELSRKIITIKGLKLNEGTSKKTGKPYSNVKLWDENNDKYTMWTKKQDGEVTVAVKQLKEMGFPINKKVGAIFKAKPNSFTNKEGKEINYTQRTIVKFEDLESATEKIEEQKSKEKEEINNEVSNTGDTDVEYEISDDNEINIEDIPF